MKMKKFWARGGARIPLDPPLVFMIATCVSNGMYEEYCMEKLKRTPMSQVYSYWREYHSLKLKIKLPCNSVPSDSEDNPATVEEWMSLAPTLQKGTSPIMERKVDQWNMDYEQSQVPSSVEELDDLVQDLRDNPLTPPAAASEVEPSSAGGISIKELQIPIPLFQQ